jgi:hypothetical protein
MSEVGPDFKIVAAGQKGRYRPALPDKLLHQVYLVKLALLPDWRHPVTDMEYPRHRSGCPLPINLSFADLSNTYFSR